MSTPPPATTSSAPFYLVAIAAISVFLSAILNNFLPRRTPRASATPDIPTLETTTPLVYLAEGAANIIYSLPSPSHYLLRMRKTLPSAQPNSKAYAYLSSTAFPLFPPHLLVSTHLVRLPAGLIEREIAVLHTLEASNTRPKKRHGMYLEQSEEFAFLVADMTPHTPRQLLVEFKPKWVVQSPSAPKDSRRCRTCALRLKKGGGTGFCPLDLVSGEAARVRRAVALLLPKRQPKSFEVLLSWEEEKEALGEVVVEFLLKSELLTVLKRVQSELDPDGPLGEMGGRFLDAMTVRDLTVFLRVDMDTREVDCGIGDLDMKTRDGGKETYWRGTETGLIEGGWYKGREGEWGCQF